MIRGIFKIVGSLAVVALTTGLLAAQQAQKPLTNDDVVKMVKAGLSGSVVVATIQANPGNYDTSANGLIKLKNAGVTNNELKGILAAQQAANGVAAGAAPANANAASPNPAPAPASGPAWQMPTVALLQNGASQPLPMEKTQLAETKMKPQSLASLAGDSAVTQGIQAGVNDAAWSAATHMNSGIAGTGVWNKRAVFSAACWGGGSRR